MEEDNKTPVNTNQNSVSNQAKNFAKEKAKEQIKKMAAKKGLATALAPILFWAAIIIIIIILLTGIIAFIITAPGLVTGKLKDFADNLRKNIANYWGGDTTMMDVSDEEQYRVLDYLEQMGYDLKGYGFIDSNVDNTDSSEYDETQGVLRHADTGKIKDANSYLVMLYLMSDNYVYTVKNFNPVTPSGNVLDTIFFYWHKISESVPLVNRFTGLFTRGIIDETAMWGKGLMSIYFEGDEWHKGKEYEKNIIDEWFGTSTTWTNIKVDAAKKTMSIRRGWGANYYEYQLDGWTGRYGMPLEFLLAVQIATLKPDLTFEMATGFNTDVLILLRDISKNSSIVSAYKTENGKYITFQEIDNAVRFTGFDQKADNWFEDFINFFDDLKVTEGEKEKLEDLGIIGYTAEELKAIIDELESANQYKFKTYVPYLSRVTDHWYRDVYFVVGADSGDAIAYGDKDFERNGSTPKRTSTSVSGGWWVETDLDYEAMTNERWTEFQRYDSDDLEHGIKKGDYKLFVYDDPSGRYNYDDLYPGTQEMADGEGIKVYKKAKTASINSLISKGIIDEETLHGSVWSAYETSDTGGTTADYKRLYPDESEDTIKGKLYYNELLSGNVKQVNDAVRRETNPKIKNMFLERKYFTYDGTAPTADIIMQVRSKMKTMGGSFKNINGKTVSYSKYEYGAVPEALLDGDGKEFTVKVQEETSDNKTKTVEKTVNIKDMVSTVSLNQDSLAAFAMLENTHTEDADFIYRDFKELIVELGFFTKEDLTEGSSKLLEWVVPETGSGGYPYRFIDKNEAFIGTKVHSKEDIDTAKEYMRDELYVKLEEMYVEPERGGIIEENQGTNTNANQTVVGRISQDNKLARQPSQISYALVKGMGSQNCSREDLPGDDGCVATVTVDGVEYKNYVQYSSAYGSEKFYWSGQYVTISSSACGPTSCVNLLTGYGQDVSPQNTIIGLRFDATIEGCKAFMEEHDVPGHTCYDASQYVTEMETAFSEGKPFIVLFGPEACLGIGDFWTTKGHFVPFVGWGSDGLYTCDPAGPGNGKRWIFPGEPSDLLPAIKGIWFADVAPNGGRKEGNPYVGFDGNEAVVSPVTGILLDYGTYDDNDAKDGYRLNTDKYVDEETAHTPDKVGYAKILVLSKEISDQLVKINSSGSKDGAKVGVPTPESPDDFEDWNENQKALYGIGLFADSYEKANVATDTTGDEKDKVNGKGRYENLPDTSSGIAGYILYIDGFKAELPNPEGQKYVKSKDKDSGGKTFEELPGGGYNLNMNVFRSGSFVINSSSLDDENLYKFTQYIPDEVFKLMSKTVQDREDAKAKGKEMAANLIKFSGTVMGETKNNWVLIKEGTVIGRTMANKELVTQLRGKEYTDPKDILKDKDSEELPPLYGNYIRMIMKDRDDNVIENIEDYIKLDDLTDVSDDLDDEKFLFWMGVYGEGGNLEDSGGKKISVPVDLDDGAGATHFYGLTHYNAGIAQQLGYNKTDSNWGEPTDLQCLTDVFLALHEQQKAQIKSELGEDIEDGYLYAFCSVLHNYGNLTKRGTEYKANHKVSESTWTTYEGTQYAEALTKRRKGEWALISESLYPPFYEGVFDKDIEWAYNGTQYSEETPFSDFCKDMGVTVNVEKTD